MRIGDAASLRRCRTLLLAVGIGLCLGWAKNVAYAASGITVTPGYAFLNVSSMASGEVQTKVTVHNGYNAPVTLHVSAVDLVQQDSAIVPASGLDKRVASVLRFSPTVFTLPAGQDQTVTVAVANNPALLAGGYYVSLLLSSDASTAHVGVGYTVSIELFIEKQGGDISHLTLLSLHGNGTPLWPAGTVVTVFRNDGNVHVVPRGQILIRDHTGTVYAEGIINQTSLPLLPGKSYTLETPMRWLRRPWLPGKYRLSVQFGYDNAASTVTYMQQFWLVPWQLLLAAIMIMVTTLYIVRIYLRRRQPKTAVKPSHPARLIHDVVAPPRSGIE